MMKHYLLLSLVALSGVHGFMFQNPVQHKALQEFAEAQEGTLLDIQLDIVGNSQQHLVLHGFSVQLLDAVSTNNHPKMPGANGPHPRLSSGPRALQVRKEAHFIDMTGTQNVALENGCWEMVWRDGAPSGSLVCGFHLENEVRRNTASLPAGRIYLSFPVWTADGLVEQQAVKTKIHAKASRYDQECREELQKMQETQNLLKKALHFRNAANAWEKYDFSGAERLARTIPDADEVMSIEKSLMITTKGTVWTKSNSFLGGDHELLGSALLRRDDQSQLRP